MQRDWGRMRFFPAIVFSAALIVTAASATSIPITGAASSNGSWAIFEFTGSNFYATSHGVNGTFGLGWCIDGSCSLRSAIDALPIPSPGITDVGWSIASLNGIEASFLSGTLYVPGSVRLPPLGQEVPARVTALGSYPFIGDFTGFLRLPDGTDRRLFEVVVKGRTRVTLDGLAGLNSGVMHVDDASYTFTGTATPTPEPGGMTLVAAALLALVLRKLTSSAHRRCHAGAGPSQIGFKEGL